MPLQQYPAIDDKLIGRNKDFAVNGPDPDKDDRVMLVRERLSHIYYLRHFFDYPISMKWSTFANMGLGEPLKPVADTYTQLSSRKKEDSLENFYINRFGKPLYNMFFEDYTEKVWGVHPSKLGADWGAQRVKGLSVFAILKDMIHKRLGNKDKKGVETSLIESFVYPKYGPGQLWEATADDITFKGGEIRKLTKVKTIHIVGNKVDYVIVQKEDGPTEQIPCQHLLSSMPLKELIPALDGIDIPEEVKRIAETLPYRDFITIGLLVKKMKVRNQTPVPSYKNRIPDTWIYIQERDVKIGRLQIFNNWSPYLLNDYANTQWIGLEYFCSEGDELWNMNKKAFIQMAVDELVHIGFIDAEDVLDSTQIKIKKAYPSYFGSYYELDKVKEFLNGIDNLYCIGRNGQHRYNNMDHSMLTAMEAVKAINNHLSDKSAIWSVNTEEEYHESK